MSRDDPRPRPRYGEYATPEEQRAAIKSPEKNPHYAPPVPDEAPSALPPYQGAPGSNAAPPTGGQGAQQHLLQEQQAASGFLRHPVDRVLTIALLVLGLYNVISAFTDRANLADELTQAYHTLGLTGDYTQTAMTQTVADAIAISFLVLWIVAAVLGTWTIARGRLAFWIPLSAGLLAAIVRAIGFVVLFVNDPTFMAYVQHGG